MKILAAAVLVGVLFPLVLVLHAHHANGGIDGFPLDDPWIHLQYARMLHDHHTFSYFPGDPAAQGSTSPLYTFLVSLGFAITRNEKVLSYVLGLLFQAAFLATLAAWARRRLGSAAWAAAAVLLAGTDARIGILAVSGMETSLFLLLVALSFWARASGRRLWAGIALGLAVWVRPDAFILAAVFALDGMFQWIPARRRRARAGTESAEARASAAGRWRTALESAAPFLLLVAAYVVFNLAIGGSVLPNTFAAKSAYYRTWPRALFLGGDVRSVFASGAWIALLPFTLFALAREAALLAKRRPGILRAEAGWALALPLAYFVLLPFAHRFGRYLVPAIPAVAVLGLAGLQSAVSRLDVRLRRAAVALVLLACAALAIPAAVQADREYRHFCLYHYVRNERTGRWLAANTPPGAVIATHDVGAIAFYSERRVVDIVGVVMPEAVRHLWSRDYVNYLADLFRRTGVTHLAFFRDWLEAVNVEPLFVADPEPEVMEVYPWIPGKTHLVPTRATSLDAEAYGQMQRGNLPGAFALYRQSLALDDQDCRTWLLFGVAQETARQPAQAEASYRRALTLFPQFNEAQFALARLLASQQRNEEARAHLRALLARRPDFPSAAALLRQLGG